VCLSFSSGRRLFDLAGRGVVHLCQPYPGGMEGDMSDWSLIYATDASGAVTKGSVMELRLAVMSGADVKVMYSTAPGVWWSRYCASASVRGSGASRLVSATYMEAADTQDGSQGLEFATPFAVEYQIYNSNGVQQMHKGGRTVSKVVTMRWYVRDYQAPPLPLELITTFIRDLEP
jgi:hypothetical protein